MLTLGEGGIFFDGCSAKRIDFADTDDKSVVNVYVAFLTSICGCAKLCEIFFKSFFARSRLILWKM